MPTYDSIPDHTRHGHFDHDMLAIDIDNLGGNANNTQDTYRHFTSTGGHHEPASFGNIFDDIEDDESVLGSKPASRRTSSASSLGDVCLPIDSPPENASGFGGAQGCHFDLSYLEEFAIMERKELLEISQATPAESILNNNSRNMTSIPGVNQLVSHAVNEMDGDTRGRLRPHRVVPWENRKSTVNGLSGTGGYSTGFVNATGGNKDSFGKRVKHRHNKQQQQQFNYPIIEDTLMRFTYFREDLEATIHSPSISGLLQPGQRFDNLFDVDYYSQPEVPARTTLNMSTKSADMPLSPLESSPPSTEDGKLKSSEATPAVVSRESSTPIEPMAMPNSGIDPSPFWLDVLNPTEEEMKVLSKAFGIHPLTTEDIFLGETREKVELFRNYYLVCFRSFDIHDERSKRKDQSAYAEDSGISGTGASKRKKKKNSSELTPLNMYIIVFHEGVITFHFSPTPHPINVRRRARLLRDYITVSSDWISYALIDDITDGFAPMIEAIDDEVTRIEDSILRMHSGESDSDDSDDEDEKISRRGSIMTKAGSTKQRSSSSSSSSTGYSSSLTTKNEKWKEKGDMLRRIGECRKRIMSILRLLGSKADVIKGFSKRCNEQWEVAPRSEIGLYLGDIQDHIVTMVQSLNHYEKLLSRAHSNYLAQLNIDMTRVNNDMNDVLSRITVLGTIVLPMNIVTGLWGMNVLVPGQNIESLTWFWGITASLFAFAIVCFVIARRVYDIA
jgi:magnesium transporter